MGWPGSSPLPSGDAHCRAKRREMRRTGLAWENTARSEAEPRTSLRVLAAELRQSGRVIIVRCAMRGGCTRIFTCMHRDVARAIPAPFLLLHHLRQPLVDAFAHTSADVSCPRHILPPCACNQQTPTDTPMGPQRGQSPPLAPILRVARRSTEYVFPLTCMLSLMPTVDRRCRPTGLRMAVHTVL